LGHRKGENNRNEIYAIFSAYSPATRAAKIKMKWIEETVRNADYTEIQEDGRIRKWTNIKEEQKNLRVILLPDGETIHNAFFDRGFKGEKK
jgi:hypothetical protein